MGTITIIILTALVIGFICRAVKLYNLIKSALYCLSLKKEMTPTMMQFQSGAVGCLGFICFPCMCFFFVTPIFLSFKVNWWIPVVAFLAGITVGNNIVGYFIERIFQLPNHQTFDNSPVNLNAIELTMDNGKLYRRAVGLMVLYCVVSLIISLIIIFSV